MNAKRPLPNKTNSAVDYESKPSPAVPKIRQASGNDLAKDVTNRGKTNSGVDSRPLKAGNKAKYDNQKAM